MGHVSSSEVTEQDRLALLEHVFDPVSPLPQCPLLVFLGSCLLWGGLGFRLRWET
jgi:hypothetical protein